MKLTEESKGVLVYDNLHTWYFSCNFSELGISASEINAPCNKMWHSLRLYFTDKAVACKLFAGSVGALC